MPVSITCVNGLSFFDCLWDFSNLLDCSIKDIIGLLRSKCSPQAGMDKVC